MLVPSAPDEHLFKSLPFWAQWDETVSFYLKSGSKPSTPTLIMHMIWCAIQWGVWYGVTVLISGGAMGEKFLFLFTRTVCLGYALTEFLGWSGMFSGPNLGNVKPPFPFTWYRFKIGTMKEPFFDFLGDTRNVFDVGLAYATVIVLLYLILTPDAGLSVCLWPACVWAFFFVDFSCYVGSFGTWFGPMSLIFAASAIYGPHGFVAAMQLLLIMIWVGCGIGKVGAWFCNLFASEWNLPAFFAGSRCMNSLFYKDVDGSDYRTTKFAVLLGHCAAVVEWGGPLLLFLTDDVLESINLGGLGFSPVNVGLFLLVSMHCYIILHLPFSDVNMINTLPILLALYFFRVANLGFDYADFMAMPLALKVVLLCFLAHMIYGQRRTDKICYMNCWRFWAGNWPQSWFILTDAAVEKLNTKIVARGPFDPFADATKLGLLPEWEIDYVTIRVSCHMWLTQLCARIFPSLLNEVTNGRPLHETNMVYGMALTNHCLGSASNCTIRAHTMLPRLQRLAQFEEGECIWICCWSFPSFGSSARYQVIDLKKGELLSGKWSVSDAMSLAKPSDGEALARTFPLKAAS
mmetsp:Transcript_113224/g.320468  ORF Transcript_113224/g.320468 Transcript_113224/m.320468 type:complete len:574 (-) Transcript_113224:79-1800(-)